MKNRFFNILITFVLAGAVYAQAQDLVERGIDNYLKALNSKNPGLVESAIINVLKLKTVYPERDYTRIMGQLERLTDHSSNRAIRFEAYVALNYLQHPERFNWISTDNVEQLDEQLVNMVLKFHEYAEAKR